MRPTTSCAGALLVLLAAATLCAAGPPGPQTADHPPLEQWLAAQQAGGSGAPQATASPTASPQHYEDTREKLCFEEISRCGDWFTNDVPGECQGTDFGGSFRSAMACCKTKHQEEAEFAPMRVQDASCQVFVDAKSPTANTPIAGPPGIVATGIAIITCKITGDCGHEGCKGLTLTAPVADAYLVRDAVAWGDVKPPALCDAQQVTCVSAPGRFGPAGGRWMQREQWKNVTRTTGRPTQSHQRRQANAGEMTACKGDALVFEGPFTVSRKDGRSTKYRDGWLTFTSFATDFDESFARLLGSPSIECGLTPAEVQGLPVFQPGTWSFAFNDVDGYGRE